MKSKQSKTKINSLKSFFKRKIDPSIVLHEKITFIEILDFFATLFLN